MPQTVYWIGRPSLVFAQMGFMKNANAGDIVTVKGKLGRVMQHQDEHLAGRQPFARGLEVSGQYLFLADPTIRKETVGRFGVGPVLTSPRDRPTDLLGKLLQQLPQPFAMPHIPELASFQFALDPLTGR